MNPNEPSETKNSVDSAKPEAGERPALTEDEKKQLELGGRMEHEHGAKRENLEERIEKLS